MARPYGLVYPWRWGRATLEFHQFGGLLQGCPFSNQSTTKTRNPDVYPQQTMFGELSKRQEQQRVC